MRSTWHWCRNLATLNFRTLPPFWSPGSVVPRHLQPWLMLSEAIITIGSGVDLIRFIPKVLRFGFPVVRCNASHEQFGAHF